MAMPKVKKAKSRPKGKQNGNQKLFHRVANIFFAISSIKYDTIDLDIWVHLDLAE